MASTLKITLTDELRAFLDSQTVGDSPYATHNDYLSNLIRGDMESQTILKHVSSGLADLKQGRLSNMSILDIADT